MAEFRHDPVHRRWIIIPSDRRRTPADFDVAGRQPDEGICPFCEGQEGRTPPEVFAVRQGAPDRPGWKVRIFPNKYPALTREEDRMERGGFGLYDWIDGIGVHEIVVEHPRHHLLYHQLGEEHLRLVLETCRARISQLMEDPRLRYVMVFKNYGRQAGATLNHQHSQIMAMPVIPRIAAMALATAREHFHVKERCLFCDIIAQELSTASRLVSQNDRFVCFAPYASRFPFELALYPREHDHDFSTVEPEVLADCAQLLHEVMNRLATLFGDPPFSMTIHTCPNTHQAPRRAHYWGTLAHDWHWHIELTPMLCPLSGFEWSTGLHVNPTAPEDAARFLREARVMALGAPV